MTEEKKEPTVEVEKETAEKKKVTHTSFHEDAFAKVFLSFVILSGVLNVASALIMDPTAVEPNVANTALAGLGFLVGMTAFVMAIIAWVTWGKKNFPKAAIALAITRVLAPIGLGVLSMIAGAFYVSQNFSKLAALEESGEYASAVLDVPIYLEALNWVGIALSILFVAWAVYLLTLKEDSK